MKTKTLNKLIAGLLILGIVGFASCEKEEVVKVFGFVQGHVYDGSNNQVIDNVVVSWEVAGEQFSTTATAAEGYKVADLYSGYYLFTFSKEGYTTIVYSISVPKDEFTSTVKGGANKEYVVDANPYLYPLTAGLTGRVYKSENSVSIPVEGAVVRVKYSNSNMVPNMYETTTDADGYYSFTNLPAGQNANISVLEYTDDNDEKYYGISPTSVSLVPDASMTVTPFTLTQVSDAMKLTGTNLWVAPGVVDDEFPINSNITLEFNHDINEALTNDLGSVTLTGGGLTSSDYVVTYNGNVVTITPNADLNNATTYSASFTVYGAQPYQSIPGTINFTTATAK